ncbi:IS66 family insertion sequence element accessory protein TnpA [Ruminiclostridium cellobioparum]|jgi:hypothetical protein|uniref:IS66 family insertion sequence element accessory protein TnpA n=1 Tax=Ruminiclostridium cellobioparum TaxID=29355 RepID=UPI000688C7F7|nr:hypothetical protein [Ruminiclostridium cellobioparum]
MNKITETKTEFRLRQLTQIIKICQESGMTVVSWCEQNNVKIKSYYYWLRKIRSMACESNSILLSRDNHKINNLNVYAYLNYLLLYMPDMDYKNESE